MCPLRRFEPRNNPETVPVGKISGDSLLIVVTDNRFEPQFKIILYDLIGQTDRYLVIVKCPGSLSQRHQHTF